MSKWTNVRKFDFTKGEYTNSYYKLNEFDYFVDTEFGSDTNDGLTPQTAFKTLNKITTLGASYYIDGLVIAFSGNEVNNFSFNKQIKLVGCGGHNSKAIISAQTPIFTTTNYQQYYYFENIFFNTLTYIGFSGGSGQTNMGKHFFNNCIIKKFTPNKAGWTYIYYYLYNTIVEEYEATGPDNSASMYQFFLGKNATILNVEPQYTPTIKFVIYFRGENYHIASLGTTPTNNYRIEDVNSLNLTNSRYFTDNTETTPADLYIDSANGNYGIVPTFSTPIWDKQTQQYIMANPLYHTGADGANIGAGVETLALTALDDSLKSTDNGGYATYTNMDNPINSVVCRIDDSIDGTLVSGLQDLGRVMNGVKIDAIATYDTNDGLITKRLQQSTPSIEQTTDFGIQFGETEQECRDMTSILCEYGKVVTYSKNGNALYGNSDLNFQPDKKKVAKFRYFIISIRAKTIS